MQNWCASLVTGRLLNLTQVLNKLVTGMLLNLTQVLNKLVTGRLLNLTQVLNKISHCLSVMSAQMYTYWPGTNSMEQSPSSEAGTSSSSKIPLSW